MQKVSSINELILKMYKILGSHELNDHAHSKIIEITFNFLEFASARKKSILHKTFWCTTKKCENKKFKLNFSLSGIGAGRVNIIVWTFPK